jgi:hypothetical protein
MSNTKTTPMRRQPSRSMAKRERTFRTFEEFSEAIYPATVSAQHKAVLSLDVARESLDRLRRLLK